MTASEELRTGLGPADDLRHRSVAGE
ncbi:MAG: hypothetical protein QOJ56_6618, partial [Mycobacterium sp.]|nr:hypothetical protein [Mycobacterium sp.]